MFRRIVVLVFFSSLFALLSVAQDVDQAAEPAVDKARLEVKNAPRPLTRGVPDAQISIVRLRVSRKARELYEDALRAVLRQDPGKAQRNLKRALKIDPQFPEALTLDACMHSARKEWDFAEHNLQAAIQTDPGYAPAYIVLAGVYNTESRFDDAQRATQQAVSAGAGAWPLDYEIARSFIGKGQYERALAVTDDALRSDHGPLIHLAKAHALLGLLRYAPAADELRVFLHDQPSGDGSQEARDLLQQVMAISSRNPDGE
jgi:tetratricopeptide (TPR) repeat protein